jgi:hypothetical protein
MKWWGNKMAKKMKFEWWFRISNDEKELEVWLNDGVNCLIDIHHPTFFEHLANKLQEINVHQFEMGTKTEITGLWNVEKAKQIRGNK